jgi:hypothetical protein
METNFERFTNFNRTLAELQHLLFFSIAVAGKNASIVSRAVNKFFFSIDINVLPPYEFISCLKEATRLCGNDMFLAQLKYARLGKYDAIMKSADYILANGLHNRLDTCTLEELEAIPYCGMKTARMILLHSRPKQRVIPLDTHILKYLREELFIPNVPKQTPGSKKNPNSYLRLENILFQHIARWEKYGRKGITIGDKVIWLKYYDDGTLNVAHLDLSIWLHYRVDTKEKK